MEIEKTIEEKNLKVTSARKELLEILSQEAKPISFEDVREKLSMNKATFYRNVMKFESEALVSSFESNNKKRYYELKDTPHAHFICKHCNTITCLKDMEPIHLKGYIIEDIIFKGTCNWCRENNAK